MRVLLVGTIGLSTGPAQTQWCSELPSFKKIEVASTRDIEATTSDHDSSVHMCRDHHALCSHGHLLCVDRPVRGGLEWFLQQEEAIPTPMPICDASSRQVCVCVCV